MGKKLAERYPGKVDFHPYKGVDHNFIIEAAAGDVYEIMIEGDNLKLIEKNTETNLK
jgi:hypothetical protein